MKKTHPPPGTVTDPKAFGARSVASRLRLSVFLCVFFLPFFPRLFLSGRFLLLCYGVVFLEKVSSRVVAAVVALAVAAAAGVGVVVVVVGG